MPIGGFISVGEEVVRRSVAPVAGIRIRTEKGPAATPGGPFVAASRGMVLPNPPAAHRPYRGTTGIPAESGVSLANLLADHLQGSVLCNELVLQQLARILKSKRFIQSDKLCRFLRFVVEHVLDGDSDCLKEYLIGVEVYDRKPSYDPSQDSIVRTEARRLRSKLRVYYENEGSADSVYIYLLPGSYVPIVGLGSDRPGVERLASQSYPKFKTTASRKPSTVVTAILPFRDLSENAISSSYARGVTDELAYALMLTEGCTVISPSSLEYFKAQEHDISATMTRIGARIAFEGSVRAEGSHLRVTARIVNAAGIQLWTKRVDAEVGTATSLALEEQIAFALSDGFGIVRSSTPDLRGF